MDSSLHHNPFQSFWWAGFECADQLNCFGHRVDLLTQTGHLNLIEADYRRLLPFHIRTVREGIRWSQVEKRAYQYDWSVVKTLLDTGHKLGVQQIWDLCHFGYPDDLSPLHPLFARRFAAMSRAFVQFYRDHYPDEDLVVTPINEVSFISWLGGDARGTTPYCINQGWEVKRGLMRAYIEAVAAMRELDPTVRILTTEPLVQIVPPLDATSDQIIEAAIADEAQFQAVDMLAGYLAPDLGGSPDYLDILGFNYYYNNQWILGFTDYLPWGDAIPDPRWLPLRKLLMKAHHRYQKPIALTETSHSGEHRPQWITMIAEECAAVLQAGVPLWGICLYPIIDRPDWDHLDYWHQAGLWDADLTGNPPGRVLHIPYAHALINAQRLCNGVVTKEYMGVSL
ncbi:MULTISPECIES: amine oxidase [unclassified Spirosoma]|uniref:amine oxidase n=1 Tax=unclassified Spirosoma TaxID=2621999 RepID=UPI00096851ED|nr:MULTISPECIES: amine oxidase [unclassified Spirosoma]MBN8825239.1 amine oxidase [Spirosoma sp.]OJW75273.1 MAG: amine oxidase [Spirosoma sp. 48-14]